MALLGLQGTLLFSVELPVDSYLMDHLPERVDQNKLKNLADEMGLQGLHSQQAEE